MDRINEMIIKRFKSILDKYENDSIEMKVRYLKITLNQIIERDMDLLDYYCDFYCKKEKLKEIENFLNHSKFVYDTSLEKIAEEMIESYKGNDEKLKRALTYKFLARYKYEEATEKENFFQKIIQEA
jgi:hypothetical protein